jgi:hypothetical protein
MQGIISCLIVLGFLTGQPQSRVSTEITFCNLNVPEDIKQANASFYVSYSFEVDEDGKPIRIHKILDDYIGEQKVSSCLSNWRFQGIKEKTKMVAMFRWQHGKGWVELAISGRDFKQVIKADTTPVQ